MFPTNHTKLSRLISMTCKHPCKEFPVQRAFYDLILAQSFNFVVRRLVEIVFKMCNVK